MGAIRQKIQEENLVCNNNKGGTKQNWKQRWDMQVIIDVGNGKNGV